MMQGSTSDRTGGVGSDEGECCIFAGAGMARPHGGWETASVDSIALCVCLSVPGCDLHTKND